MNWKNEYLMGLIGLFSGRVIIWRSVSSRESIKKQFPFLI